MSEENERRTSFGERKTTNNGSSANRNSTNDDTKKDTEQQGKTGGANGASNENAKNERPSSENINQMNQSKNQNATKSETPKAISNTDESTSNNPDSKSNSESKKTDSSGATDSKSKKDSTEKSGGLKDKASSFLGDKNNQDSIKKVASSENKGQAIKDEVKNQAKKKIKSQAMKGVAQASKAAAVPSAKVGGVAAAGLGVYLAVVKGIKAIGSSAPAVMIQQLANMATSAISTVTNVVNGAVNGVLGALNIATTVSGSLPTIISSVLVTVVGGTTIIATTGSAVVVVEEGESCDKPDDIKDDDDTENGSTGGGVVGGDYKDPNSEKYKIAEQLFNNFVKKNGWSGAGASGGVGNAIRESGLNPKADNPSGGVHGLFQWSGWSSQINGNRWGEAPNGKDDSVINQIGLINKELRMAYYKPVNENAGKAMDFREAAGHFAQYYEGLAGGSGDPQFNPTVTYAGAEWAYEEFGGADIPSDDTNFEDTDGDNDDEKHKEDQENDNCDTSSSGGSGEVDGTGAHDSTVLTAWRPADVPADVQKFAYSPESIGMMFESPVGWWNPGNQCVNLASSYFQKIWGMTEQARGNGHELAQNWSKVIDGEISNTPKKGALVSITGNVPGVATAPYGHTNIVQHVYKNGDILVIEQNYPGKSGEGAGMTNSWHYQILEKSMYQEYKFEFLNPNPKKYDLDMGKTIK